jgi:hypothetical protein
VYKGEQKEFKIDSAVEMDRSLPLGTLLHADIKAGKCPSQSGKGRAVGPSFPSIESSIRPAFRPFCAGIGTPIIDRGLPSLSRIPEVWTWIMRGIKLEGTTHP